MSMLAAPREKWFARFEVERGETEDETAVDEWEEPEGEESDETDAAGEEWEDDGEEVVAETVPMDYREVVAWDGEGHAMVVDFSGGRLRRANEMAGFSGLATWFEWKAVGSDAGDDEG
ncbi:hypothetical protein [Streptomyces sp. NPDC000961]|uniref:hypothetical protein n=1 Tax=Streptomyces sp. NPDC000961 TaxID=3364541 RepID=UPI0036842337